MSDDDAVDLSSVAVPAIAAATTNGSVEKKAWLARYPGFAACVLFAVIFFALFRSGLFQFWRQQWQQQHHGDGGDDTTATQRLVEAVVAPAAAVVLAVLCYLLVVNVAGGGLRRV